MSETKRPINELYTSPFRLWLGLIIGFLYAFVLYGFLYMSRETLRFLAINTEYDLPVLNGEEQIFYNLFAGLLAGVLAQSVVLRFWLDRPIQPFSNRDHRRRVILNDAVVLHWYFMHWMAKIVLIIANFFYFNTTDYYVLSFYPEFWFLFVLILGVLFLHPWIAVRRIYKNKAFKMIGLAFVIIVLNGLLLATINWIDIEKINQFILSKNIKREYHLQLPEVNNPEEYFLREEDEVLYMVLSDGDKTIIFYNQTEYNFDQLKLDLDKENLNKRGSLNSVYWLNIDARCNYGDVLRLQRVLQEVGIHRVCYFVLPIQREFDVRYYTRQVVSGFIPYNKFPKPPFIDNSKQHYTDIILSPSKVLINDIEKNNLWQEDLKNMLKEKPHLVIHFYCEDNVPYGNYIQFKHQVKEVLREVRMSYLKQYYGRKEDFSDYTSIEQLEARRKFQVQIKEMYLFD